jgi:hypothetical protein
VEDCQKFDQRGPAILDENLGPFTVLQPCGRYFTRAGGVRSKLALAPAFFADRRLRSAGLSITSRSEVSTYPQMDPIASTQFGQKKQEATQH